MKKILILSCLIGGLLITGYSCEKNKDPEEEVENPFILEEGENGFSLGDSDFSTPNAFIEIYDPTDSLSANFDVTLTDGSYNSFFRIITNYGIKVYFDLNSPSFDSLHTGEYYIDGGITREPYKIVEAYIEEDFGDMVSKYPVLSGIVNVSESQGYYKVEYEMTVVYNGEKIYVEGLYAGIYNLIDQRFESNNIY